MNIIYEYRNRDCAQSLVPYLLRQYLDDILRYSVLCLSHGMA